MTVCLYRYGQYRKFVFMLELHNCLYSVLQTKMVQHIRKKHPEFAQLANTIHTPLTTAVISSAPAVISADGTTAEAVVVRQTL